MLFIFYFFFQVRVLYTFDAQPGTGEMSVQEGEILNVTRVDVGEGWWEGTNSQGVTGLFPAAYVEVGLGNFYILLVLKMRD